MSALDLSVVIITRNEEADLPACLESVRGLASEVVIVDARSTDRTPEVARSFGARWLTRDFDDYASQKQHALEQATRAWALSLDADERVTPGLAEELRQVLPAAACAGFSIPFETEFLGRVLRHGGPGSERHVRLLRRGAGRFVGGALHEGLALDGPVGGLAGAIRHVPYRDLDEYLEKLGRYTTLAARKRWEAGRRAHLGHHLLPFWELFVRLILRLGILDGRAGVVYAGLAAFHTWIKYVKLAEFASDPANRTRIPPTRRNDNDD
ncbi:MAG: glycosyltransferase family 2 protein [Elusimicrobia bacterium]|nr:glycosyltransferase family 2 protein [Elusimicrobiota bacterium]